ncbi:MAG: hypothetical protein AVDCRST_MAG49-3971, partial [uncultured Thermomicrobiales bacterium]
ATTHPDADADPRAPRRPLCGHRRPLRPGTRQLRRGRRPLPELRPRHRGPRARARLRQRAAARAARGVGPPGDRARRLACDAVPGQGGGDRGGRRGPGHPVPGRHGSGRRRTGRPIRDRHRGPERPDAPAHAGRPAAGPGGRPAGPRPPWAARPGRPPSDADGPGRPRPGVQPRWHVAGRGRPPGRQVCRPSRPSRGADDPDRPLVRPARRRRSRPPDGHELPHALPAPGGARAAARDGRLHRVAGLRRLRAGAFWRRLGSADRHRRGDAVPV